MGKVVYTSFIKQTQTAGETAKGSKMNQNQMNQVLDQAEIVLRERGYTQFERRTESTEYDSTPLTYLVAKKDGGKAEAYPRNTRTGVSYKIYED